MRLGVARATINMELAAAKLSSSGLSPEDVALVLRALMVANMPQVQTTSLRSWLKTTVRALARAQARLNASHASLKIRKGNSEHEEG